MTKYSNYKGKREWRKEKGKRLGIEEGKEMENKSWENRKGREISKEGIDLNSNSLSLYFISLSSMIFILYGDFEIGTALGSKSIEKSISLLAGNFGNSLIQKYLLMTVLEFLIACIN